MNPKSTRQENELEIKVRGDFGLEPKFYWVQDSENSGRVRMFQI